MEVGKRGFEFYINSSIHAAVSVISLVCVSLLNFNLQIDFSFFCFVFFGTITGYNFVKYAGIAKLHHRSLAKNLRWIQIFSFFCFFGLIYFLFQQTVRVAVTSFFLGLLTFLYALPVFRNKKNLRNFSGLKIFIIAFVWAGVTVILPLIDQVALDTPTMPVEFIQRFLFIIVLILPFEIRDMRYDNDALQTIPQKFGVKKTKKMGFLLLLIVILIEFLKDVTGENSLSLILTGIITAVFLQHSKVRQSRYYASFYVEGIPLLWLGTLFFLKIT